MRNLLGFVTLSLHEPFIHTTYTRVLPYLTQKGFVEIKPLTPLPHPPPRGYDANVRCDFHAGSPEHTTEKCLALKLKVQDLLDRKIISFTPEGLNVYSEKNKVSFCLVLGLLVHYGFLWVLCDPQRKKQIDCFIKKIENNSHPY